MHTLYMQYQDFSNVSDKCTLYIERHFPDRTKPSSAMKKVYNGSLSKNGAIQKGKTKKINCPFFLF